MIELLLTVAMTVVSCLLFGYWFRYTCLLILSTKTVRDYAATVAAVKQLDFPEVQARLRQCSSANLDQLHAALDRDYAVVVALLQKAVRNWEQSSIETRMLQIDYRYLAAWSRLCRRFPLQASCRALEEMSQVVAHFANVMGQAAGSPAAARYS